LEKLLVDDDTSVNEQAIVTVSQMRKVVKDDEKEFIIKLII
jgi:hypothetical protein